MLISSIPQKIDIVFGQSASGSNIRNIPDTSSDPNAASWTLGFPPNTFVDPGSGGEPPDGRDFNGVLNRLSQWARWQQAGAPVFFDAAFSSAVGGYPKWAQLANLSTPGLFWISTVDNNTGNPDAGAPNWLAFPPALPPLVTSFNGRTGAVNLTQADALAAIGPNGLPNPYLALMGALTVKANVTGSPATPQDVGFGSLLAALGFAFGTSGPWSWFKIPAGSPPIIVQLATITVSAGHASVVFPQSYTAGAPGMWLTAGWTGAPLAVGAIQTSSITSTGASLQVAAGSGFVTAAVDILVIGR